MKQFKPMKRGSPKLLLLPQGCQWGLMGSGDEYVSVCTSSFLGEQNPPSQPAAAVGSVLVT